MYSLEMQIKPKQNKATLAPFQSLTFLIHTSLTLHRHTPLSLEAPSRPAHCRAHTIVVSRSPPSQPCSLVAVGFLSCRVTCVLTLGSCYRRCTRCRRRISCCKVAVVDVQILVRSLFCLIFKNDPCS